MEPLPCPDLLDALQFEYDTDNTLAFIETSPEAVSQLSGSSRRVLRHVSLSQAGLMVLLQHEDIDDTDACKDGFRLLVCQRSLQDPITIFMSEANFSDVLKRFNLAPETKPSILQFLGACGKHIVFTKSNNQKCLQIIIKAYQKGEIGNFTLSLCHNFETAWTDALVCWTEWHWSRRMHMREKLYESRMAHILALLNSWQDLWAHPTCLPLVFLSSYCRRVEERCNTLSDSLVELDCQLGVNRSGRMYSERDMKTWPTDLDFKTLIVDLHSASNRVTFVHQACQWAIRCASFLLDLESEIERDHILGNTSCRPITEFLQYRKSVMRGVEVAFEGLKARTQAATNVLFNASSQNDSLVAQRYSQIAHEQNDLARKDNLLNIKIASSTKEDSISMSTFTFITALFLPGTFISSFFSMALIDWQSTPNSGSAAYNTASVSNYFWVFWAIDIPLTAGIMLAWWYWFRWQKMSWLKDNDQVLSTDLSSVPAAEPRAREDKAQARLQLIG